VKRVLVILFVICSFLVANETNIVNKIVNLYNIKTNGVFGFNATKSGDGYDITVSPQDAYYKEILNPKLMHISVDEGPIVTSPKFTLAKAGLSSKGSFFDLLKPDIASEMKKGIKQDIQYRYAGIVSFGGELSEEFTIDPLKVSEENVTIETSKLKMKSKTDLESLKGRTEIELEHLLINDNQSKQMLKIDGAKVENIITDKPVDGIVLFGKTIFNIKELVLQALAPQQKINAKLTLDASSAIKKIDSKLLDANFLLKYKALDAQSILLMQGFKSGDLEIEFKNFGIQGVLELLHLSQKLQKINMQMMAASSSGNDIELQKAIIASSEIMNELIPAINHTLLKDKSRIVLNWQMQSDKTNYIKANFLYKGEPLAGSTIQGAFISLMAQQLALVDGSFDIALERDVIAKINPLSLLFIDMLKQKGFITEKNSLYRLKGELKSGKIILNGKAYTLQELTAALF